MAYLDSTGVSTLTTNIKALADTTYTTVRHGSIALSATWTGAGPYTQSCTATGCTITEYSKVDLQPDTTTLQQLMDDGIKCMYIENNNGSLTCYSLGGVPSTSISLQCTVTEIMSGVNNINNVPSAEGISF